MPVPKKARALEREVVTKKATAKAAVTRVKTVAAKKVTSAKKATAKTTAKTAPKKAVAKATPIKKKVLTKPTPKASVASEETVSVEASSGVGVILKDTKKQVKGSAAYNRAAMKMAGQIVKGKKNRKADSAREKALEALLRRNGVDDKPEEVSVETSYRVGEDEQGVTLFSRVKTDRAVILTARVFGFGFVVLGACFTLLTVNRAMVPDVPLPFLSVVDGQLASLLQGTIDPNQTNILDPISSSLPTPVAPTVEFLSLPSGEARGVIEVSFKVPADAVMVDVYNRDTKQWLKLGSAKTSDNQVWKQSWNTANSLPGTYDVIAIVKNSAGTFHIKSDRSVEVADQTDNDDAETTASTGSSTTTANTAAPSGTFFELRTSLSSPLTSRTPVYLTVAQVSSVRATLVQESTKKVVGSFSLNNPAANEWRFVIDPSNYTSGAYQLKFAAQTNTGSVVASPVYKLSLGAGSSSTSSPEEDLDDEAPNEVADDEALDTATATSTPTPAAGLPAARIRSDTTAGAGSVVLFAETQNAIGAEFFARPASSLKDIYIGLGTKVSEDTWRLVWDTKQTPNGTYEVFSRHRSALGVYSSTPINVSVKNLIETTLTTEQKSAINEIANTETLAPNPVKSFIEGIDPANSAPRATTSTTSDTSRPSDEDTDTETPVAAEERPQELLPYFTYRGDIEAAMTAYGKALRTSDATSIEAARVAVLELKKEMVNSINPSEPELRERLVKMVEDDVRELTQQVEEVEEIIRARVGEAVAKDSDKDTVTDYDEVNLYKTNPFSADSDGDGFTDAAEITGGYDPLNDAPESLIAFESPKEAGVVREDILTVTGIAAAEEVSVDTNDDQALKVQTAVITGMALPNSFVTIYIFSTPIIVTVKTNDDGSWSYRFDKELEDGEHEVFVGVTDNAGKIVAKSNPFTFVKEAQAFTPVDAEASLVSSAGNQAPSFFSQQALVIALGGVVIALGLILLMISMYLIRRQEKAPTLDTAHVV